MKNKLLTVAIPTYNRPETLEVIIKQFLKEDPNKFELLIADDASPDNGKTAVMIKKYQDQMPNLTYHRNPKNLGFSGNVLQLYDMTKTDYIWYLCDDDEVTPGCIDEIIERLNKHNPTVAVLNHTWVDPYGVKKTAGVNENQIYADIEDLTDYQPLMRMTLLSTLVLKRIISTDEIRKTNYDSNVFVQITLGLLILSKDFKYAELAITPVNRIVGYKYGEFFKFITVDYLRAIFAVDHAFDNDKFIQWAKREIPVQFRLYLSQKLGLFKHNGFPTIRTMKEIIQFYGIHSILIFLFVPVYFLTPAFILKWIYKNQLYQIHGKEKGYKIYESNIDRAIKDGRKTGFTEYR